MKVLIACEYSGRSRDAFRALGHDAWSCDLLPAEDNSEFHIQGDLFDVVASGDWDLLIAHPPCTYLCSSGLHWNGRVEGRAEKTEEALEFVRRIMALPVPRIAIENPVGCIGTRIRKADQYVQPYEFGDDASKKTGLWLKGLPLLVTDPADFVMPRTVVQKNGTVAFRWDNQTDSGQNKLTPGADRWKERSRTYMGIANAMAAQWGGLVEQQRIAA